MRCKVANCKSENKRRACDISFFSFPSDETLAKKWVQFCRRENAFNTKTSYVCMKHFTTEDIQNNRQFEMGLAKKRLLKHGVVPSIYTKDEENSLRAVSVHPGEYKLIVSELLQQSESVAANEEISKLQDSEMCTTDPSIKKWQRWCRLCAKHDGYYFDMFLEQSLSSDINLRSIIEDFFHIKIGPRDGLPTLLCTECCSAIASLEKYAQHIKKVQKMYKDLKNTAELADINLKDLYQKYGLFECESNLPQSTTSAIEQIFVSDVSNSDVKAEEIEIDVDFSDPFANDNENMEECSQMSVESEASDSKTDSEFGSDEFAQQIEEYIEEVGEGKDEGSYSCSICQLSFMQSRKYMYHMKSRHGPKAPIWNCSYCSSSFTYKRELERHTKQIHEPSVYPCPHCERKFTRAKFVENHINEAHSLICEECGECVPSKQKLAEHMAIHTGRLPYECEVCGRQYPRKVYLKRHMEVHGDKHICAECSLEFKTSQALRRHSKVHSDKKPHVCNYCGDQFKRSKNLKNHLITHTGLKPYSCDFCESTFSSGSSCRFHKRRYHPKELAEQEKAGVKPYTKNVPTLNVLRAMIQAAGKVQKDDASIGNKRKRLPKLDAELVV
ncbi:zinc finger protein weckle-like isoform X1 [Anastrepha obliqua]|uniref:zinc finger protein weckle-like isoform X1 n=1 Tax=Anastrepha obliqua TaxID=95512 RepID=UPI002409623A|nr:zinc finger protein weckle-like isoform X1 [Anastrepha obliqua]